MNRRIHDLIIIGGGPAGITAGIYASRQKLDTLLITKDFGGQMTRKAVAIENYPGFKKISGIDLVKKFRKHLNQYPVEVKLEAVNKIKKSRPNFLVSLKNKESFESRSVIIASGADPRPLKVPGEKKFIGKGVSYCTACDGPMYQDKAVAVVGGGNAGFEAAIFLKDLAKKVYLLEFKSEPSAQKILQEKLKGSDKVQILTKVALKEIKGDKFVESVIYEDRKTHQKKTLKVEGVFIEIGTQPASSFAKDLVDLNDRSEIKVEKETLRTKTPGLFAAGDVNVGKYKQIVTACGEGAKAALSAYQWIRSNY